MFSHFGWAFQRAPTLLEYLRFMDPGCIWDDIKFGRTKCRDLITNVIGQEEKERIATIYLLFTYFKNGAFLYMYR